MKNTTRLVVGLLCLISSPVFCQQSAMLGFGEKAAAAHKALEARFDQHLSREHIGRTIQELSAKPHELGSANGKAVAEAILAKFKSYGWDAKIETYYVLFPTPKVRVLEMTAPTVYKALLQEKALAEDSHTGQEGQLPPYNAFSADGDVTGELVFVNYGLQEDYEKLKSLGIDVKGKIVIAKYGNSWRGIKPKIAQEHGAIGCLIYSDPKEDGFYQGDVYPKGPFKNEYGVQRGSVKDMVIYSGDALTPNVAATKDAKRLDRKDAKSLLKIPVLPISYHDALPLLSALEGPVAPAEWRGALPIAYHIGPGKATVRLKVEFNWDITPAYNVIAKMKGSQYPDEWVIRGNHHDAWVNGAADPISALSGMLEEAKAIGLLAKKGYKPKRTLVYCAWDGEEPGLLGSTEWVEDHAAELRKKAVVYINSDNNGRGFLKAGGSHALQAMVNEVAHDVVDPQTKTSVHARRKAQEVAGASTLKAKGEALAKKDFNLRALGSGSDYTPFLQHVGIPTLSISYGGEDTGGEYHTIYDTYENYVRFKDPGFHYGLLFAQTVGRVVLRMAEAEALPFDYRQLHRTIAGYAKEVQALATQAQENTLAENNIIKSGSYRLAADPTKPFIAQAESPPVPTLDFSALQKAVALLEESTNGLAEATAGNGKAPEVKRLNKVLYQAEQHLLMPGGLPRRAWYKHAIYAPGFYTGYGVKTLPGIREAIEQRDWQEAQEQIAEVAQTIHAFSDFLAKGAGVFK